MEPILAESVGDDEEKKDRIHLAHVRLKQSM